MTRIYSVPIAELSSVHTTPVPRSIYLSERCDGEGRNETVTVTVTVTSRGASCHAARVLIFPCFPRCEPFHRSGHGHVSWTPFCLLVAVDWF